MNLFRRLYIALAAATAAATVTAAAPDPLTYGQPYAPLTQPGEWRVYSAFDNLPRRIMESPDKVFFLVHQHPYGKTVGTTQTWFGYYDTSTGALFILDKNNPDAGLKDLANVAKLSDHSILSVNYNPTGDYLLVVYVSGMVDIVKMSDYSVIPCDDLTRDNYPGMQLINNITFDRDSSDAWIATAGGFIRIDSATGAVKDKGHWMEGVNSVGRTGDKVVLISGNAIYEAPLAKNISNKSSFVKTELAATEPLLLMPLGEGRYAFFDKVGSQHVVMVGTPGDDGATVLNKEMSEFSGLLLAANQETINRVEYTAQMTRDGYLINVKSKSMLLPYSASTSKKEVKQTGNPLYVSTWDWTEFWTFQDPMGFKKVNTSWADISSPIRPNAPLVSARAQMQYFDGYGLVVTNSGPNREFPHTNGFSPLLLNVFKDGVWTNHSYRYTGAPDAIAADANLLNSFNRAMAKSNVANGRYPMCDPKGLVRDPVYPQYAHMGSLWDGISAVNIADTKATPYILSTTGQPNANLADISLPRGTWAGIVNLRAMGADSEGTIWASKGLMNDPKVVANDKMKLYYWTKEARAAAFAADGVNRNLGWKFITINNPSTKVGVSMCDEAYMLTHEKNKNKFIIYFDGMRTYAVYDHKGTLDDTSDDEFIPIVKLMSNNGAILLPDKLYGVYEDPIDGKVYLTTMSGFFSTDLEVDGKDMLKVSQMEVAGIGASEKNPNLTYVNRVCFDEYNRMWLSSPGYGIIGIGADRKTVIADCTPANSGLPSDDIFEICWNPDTQSLFVATRKGIAEFKADAGSQLMVAASELKAYPQTVTPGYAGTVALHGVAPSASLVVMSKKSGERIASIPAAQNGITYWNLKDADGNPVKSGRYEIRDINSAAGAVEISVVK